MATENHVGTAGNGTREPCPIHKPMPCPEDCPNSPETHAQQARDARDRALIAYGRRLERAVGLADRRPAVLADVLSDHHPEPTIYGRVRCSCNDVRYEWPDWRVHVGQAQAAALTEDAAHTLEHGCVISPALSAEEATE